MKNNKDTKSEKTRTVSTDVQDDLDLLPARKRLRKTVIVLLLLCGAFAWILYGDFHLTVSDYVYENAKIDDNLDGFRIVQISDLHNTLFGISNSKLVSRVVELNPDIIVITGDIIDSSHTDMTTAINFVRDMTSIADVYYVTGNHEFWISDEERQFLLDEMAKCGAIIADNGSITIEYNGSSFALFGLGDNNLCNDTLSTLIDEYNAENMTDDYFSVLLAHEPQYISRYARCGMDLVLAGHAHGGQIVVPFIGPLYAPDQGFSPEYVSGRYDEGMTTMYVSRGLGNSVIPVRIFNDPEIVCIDLKKAE